MLYPKEIDIDPKQIERLTQIFKQAYKEIVAEINTATNFGVANRKQILAQIEAILKKLGVNVDKFLRAEMPTYYKLGAQQAINQLKNAGVDLPISSGLNKVHLEAINTLISDTMRSFGESISGVGRSANQLLGRATREMITRKLAKNIIAGDALRQVKTEIKGILADKGLDALVDKAGRSWTLDRYAETLFRTKVVEARNRGMINRVAEEGYDLVQVSDNGSSACPLCEPWQGKILSVSGDNSEYEALATAEAAGLFHPNCRHAINTIVPSLARQTQAYDAETESYGKPGASISGAIK